jgi:hypothetical protein
MPSGFIVSTAASLALDVNEADISLPTLTSAAGGVRITTGTTTVTNVSIANLTNGAVTTSANTIALANADVDLGAGHPATTTTVKSLIAGNATTALAGATIVASGSVDLATKVVGTTSINAGGNVTLSSGVTGSSVTNSTFNSEGDISIAALTIGAGATAITTDGGGGGSITLGATTSTGAITAVASGSTISAASLNSQITGAMALTATSVNLSGLATMTTALTVNTATSLSLPALVNTAAANTITGAAVTNISAPLLTTAANVDVAAAATISLGALAALGNLVDVATVKSLTLAAQDVDLDLSTAVLMTTLDYTGAASSGSLEDTDLTYAVFTAASSLTTVSIAGALGDVILKAPLMTSIATSAGSTVRTFTTSGTALTSVSVGHQGYNGGARSGISVVDTKITTLDLSATKWFGLITLTGNASMTTVKMPTDVSAANNVNVTNAGGNVDVTITGNDLAGAWTASVSATASNLYTEGSFSTAPGITGAKTWLEALIANVVVANASVTYNIQVDDASAAMIANNNSTALNGGNIDTAAELALLPN